MKNETLSHQEVAESELTEQTAQSEELSLSLRERAEQEELLRRLSEQEQEILPEKQEMKERIADEFNKLWDMYAERREGVTMQYGRDTITDDVTATRYFDNHAIEETYWRTTIHSPRLKGGVTELYFIRIASDKGEREICAGGDGEVKVLNRTDTEAPWTTIDEADPEWQNTLDEFFHRTLIAAEIHNERTPEEQQAANESAKRLLREQYPILADRKTSEE